MAVVLFLLMSSVFIACRQARKIRNRPVVNTNPLPTKQMQDEIVLLREELAMAKLEASRLMQVRSCEENRLGVCKSSKSTQIWKEEEREEGLVEEEEKWVGDGYARELERRLARSQDILNQCLKVLKDMLESVLWNHCHTGTAEADNNEGEEEEEKVELGLKRCLLYARESQRLLLEGGGLEDTIRASLSAQTTFLCSELDLCRKVLCTDEQVFAERLEVVDDLPSTSCMLAQDKEQVESMWEAVQDIKTRLPNQLESQKVAMLGRVGVVDEDTVGVVDEETVGVVGKEEVGVVYEEAVGVVGEEAESMTGGELDINSGIVNEDSLEEGGGQGEARDACSLSSSDVRMLKLQKFTATRSLLQGQVQTSHLEVHIMPLYIFSSFFFFSHR